MSSHFKCAVTHVVFGVLLFVMGIVDIGLNLGDFWIGLKFFVIVCGLWMCITGVLARKSTSCGHTELACVFITSSLCGIAAGGCYSFLLFALGHFCGSSCGPEKTVAAIVLTLSIVQCIAGCSGCHWVTSSSSQADQISFSPFTVPAGDAQMVPTGMPPQSVFQDNDRPPPYEAGSQDPDLLLVPLEITPMSLQSIAQQNDRPPPYTVDAQTCSRGSDLLLVPLEMNPMPPLETGPPPPYHQVSTTGSVMSSFHDGDQPPAYVCTDEQHRVTTYV